MIPYRLLQIVFITCSSLLSDFFSQPVKEMSLEEKVGQLLMVHFHGEEVNDDARFLVQKLHVGGIIYYNWSNGLHSPQQISQLSFNLQKLTKQNPFSIPLLITVDQEGGIVNRLTNGFTIFPGNKALAMTGNPTLGELSAFAMGQELRAVGINMNLSPVVDVNCYSRSPVIGIRSFGPSVDQVVSYARNVMLGYSRAGIIASLKHYPGHGDVDVDSHADLPILRKTKAQLEALELLPFSELAGEAEIVMTAHMMVPAFDLVNCTTLSKDTLDYLRNEMKFDGVIMTDSLVMEGLLKNCASIDEAAIRALNAGCDMILLGGKQMIGSDANLELTVRDIERIHGALVSAVKSGVVSQERLNDAVQRILKLKHRNSVPIAMAMENLAVVQSQIINIDQHQFIAEKTAALSLRKIKNKSIGSLNNKKIALFAPLRAQESIAQTSLLEQGEEVYPFYFRQNNPTEDEIKAACEMSEKADMLIFCSYDAWKNHRQSFLLESLLNQKKPLILISLSDPFDATLFPEADLILITFSPTAHSIQAAADELRLINLLSFSISQENVNKISERIWKNECGGTVNGLTFWNHNESFGSFGIGHFIWYPEGQKGKFQETFPELLAYLQDQGVVFPDWLKKSKKCPWKSREEFYSQFQSPKLVELRQLLFDTKNLQAMFLAKRLENLLPQMIENLPPKEKENVATVFSMLASEPGGLYALIDYLNFKGSGISKGESYLGQKWGLLQVIQFVHPSSKQALGDFVEAAKVLLAQRVKNSPIERNEKKWLPGWINRVNTYLHSTH